jgi:hypothetical protein
MKDFIEQTVQRRTGRCCVDPITLTGLALAGIGAAGGAGVAALASGGSSAPTSPTAIPAPSSAAPPVQQPVGSQKSSGAGNTPSFIGSSAAPSQVGYGQKSLLGQ